MIDKRHTINGHINRKIHVKLAFNDNTTVGIINHFLSVNLISGDMGLNNHGWLFRVGYYINDTKS